MSARLPPVQLFLEIAHGIHLLKKQITMFAVAGPTHK
jgi:hypothetical protein